MSARYCDTCEAATRTDDVDFHYSDCPERIPHLDARIEALESAVADLRLAIAALYRRLSGANP